MSVSEKDRNFFVEGQLVESVSCGSYLIHIHDENQIKIFNHIQEYKKTVLRKKLYDK